MSELQTTQINPQPSIRQSENRTDRSRKKRQRIIIVNLVMLWILLIIGGLYGAYTYMNHMEQKLSVQVEQKTIKKIEEMQSDYDTKLAALDEQYSAQMQELNTQITNLNELLTFVKDSATNDNSDSNKLYTQINEIKSQLQKLQKSMELLK